VLENIGRFIVNYDKDCRLCGGTTETVDHLFLHCPVTQTFLFASPLGIRNQNMILNSVRMLLSRLLDIKDDGTSFGLCACLMWSWWKARNRLVFDGKKPFIPAIIKSFQLFENYAIVQNNDVQEIIPTSNLHDDSWTPLCHWGDKIKCRSFL
ncbi:hypothetical protein MKW92_014468, partial [Papaver armeniacum]